MRQRHSGRIITVGSLAGLVGIPGLGFYAASKFAIEGFNEALRYEVESFGIKVSIIEPGFFKTNLHKGMVSGKREIRDYDGLRNTIVASTKNSVLAGGDPEKVAALIARVASTRKPALRYRVGLDALWAPRLKRFLPQQIFLMIISRWVKYAGGETRSRKLRFH
jgi:NAD(P)-dependent dehydrogenase (short-subunit alcohol dehydrogenase family)